MVEEQKKLQEKISTMGKAKEISKPRFGYVYSVQAIQEMRDFFFWNTSCLSGVLEFIGFILFPVIIVLGSIINAISYIIRLLKENSDYKKRKAEYEMEFAKDRDRVSKEMQQKPLIQARIDQLDKQINSTVSLLNKLYDVGIIYPKYRSLVPVVMFCEYIESGRCDQLSGHEGAYNTYENELRQDIIIGKLDVIISKLDQIKANQWMLYDAIERVNQNVSRLCDATYQCANEMKNISQNSVIIAENSRLNTQYNRILSDLEKFKLYIDDSITTTIPNQFLY